MKKELYLECEKTGVAIKLDIAFTLWVANWVPDKCLQFKLTPFLDENTMNDGCYALILAGTLKPTPFAW